MIRICQRNENENENCEQTANSDLFRKSKNLVKVMTLTFNFCMIFFYVQNKPSKIFGKVNLTLTVSQKSVKFMTLTDFFKKKL